MKKIVSLLLALTLIFSMSAALAETGDGTLGGNKCTIKVTIPDDRTPTVEWTYPAEIKINATKSGDTWSFELADTYKLAITTLLMKNTQVLNVGFGSELGNQLVNTGFVSCLDTQQGPSPLQNAEFALEGAKPNFNAQDVEQSFTSTTWEFPIQLKSTSANDSYEEIKLSPHIIYGRGIEYTVNEGLYFAVQLADSAL